MRTRKTVTPVARDRRPGYPHRILVGYNGSEASFWALEQAADVAESIGAAIGVVTVTAGPGPIDDRLLTFAKEALRYLEDRGLRATLHLRVGDPATEIAAEADAGAYDIIYLGNTETEIGAHLRPGTAERLPLRTPVEVLVAR